MDYTSNLRDSNKPDVVNISNEKILFTSQLSGKYIDDDGSRIGMPYYIYDLSNKTFVEFPNIYLDKITDGPSDIYESNIVIPLRGSDGKKYNIITDDHFNIKHEPFLGDNASIVDGMLIVPNNINGSVGNILDIESLTPVIEQSEIEVVNGISEGVFVIYNSSENNYYFKKYDGTTICDSIDFSKAKNIVLE